MHWSRQEVCASLKFQRSPLREFWQEVWMHGGLEFQSNNIGRHLGSKY